MNTALKGFRMTSLAKHGRKQIVVYALTIEDAKAIAFAEHGVEFYFKGYQS